METCNCKAFSASGSARIDQTMCPVHRPPRQAFAPDHKREVKNGTYWRHFKGAEYLVYCHATPVDGGEELVIYSHRYPGSDGYGTWARPLSDFVCRVRDDNGQIVDRFTEIRT